MSWKIHENSMGDCDVIHYQYPPGLQTLAEAVFRAVFGLSTFSEGIWSNSRVW